MTCKHIWAGQTRLKLRHHSRLETGRIRILYGQYKGLARAQARSTLTLSKTDLSRPLKLETNLCFGWKKLKTKLVKTGYQFRNWLKYEDEKERNGTKQKCPSYAICYIAGNFSQAAHALIGYFEVTWQLTWYLTMKLFPAKISDRATLQNLWRQRVKVHRYPRMLTNERRYSKVIDFQPYKKSLKDWSLRKQSILSPSNFKILGKQNKLCPEGPVIKC